MTWLDQEFTDLFLGVGYASFKKNPGETLLHDVPQGFHDELNALFAALNKQATTDGDEFAYEAHGIRFRVTRMETVEGPYYILRKPQCGVRPLEEISFPKEIANPLFRLGAGLVVFCGQMGAGKTTSASAYLGESLQRYGGHSVTIEDPPEIRLHGPHGEGMCFQSHAHHENFGPALVHALRSGNPRTIYLGELRESGGVDQAILAALNGHLIVSTLHSSGIREAINRLIAFSTHNKTLDFLADGLAAIVHQQFIHGRLRVNALFNDDQVRNLIREGKIHQLENEIDRQKRQRRA